MKKYFYIQDTQKYDGNAILLWNAAKSAYTSNVAEASFYGEEEALKIVAGRTTYVAIPMEDIKSASIKVVMAFDLRRLQEEKAGGRVATKPLAETPSSSFFSTVCTLCGYRGSGKRMNQNSENPADGWHCLDGCNEVPTPIAPTT